MKILYVGNFTRPWCTEVHVAASLESLGHRVVRAQENTIDWSQHPGVRTAIGRTDDVELVLWTRTWAVDSDAATAMLERFRDAGAPSAAFHLDRWFGLDREYQVTTEPFFQAVDAVFTADGGHDAEFAAAGVPHTWLPPGVFDVDCRRRGRRLRQFVSDVAFVGSHPYPHPAWAPYRDELIGRLRGHFGDRFKLWPQGRAVRGQALNDLYASAAVMVGDSCLAGGAHRYWSDRVPETIGRGGFIIHPFVGGLEEWYPTMPTYTLGDFDGLIEQIEWWLARPNARAEKAEELRAVVLTRDTYKHRMATLLDTMSRGRGVASLHGWSARFTPRPVDIAGTDFVVVVEVWNRNDYRIPASGLSGTVLDVGANIGAFSVLAAKAGAQRVIAVEPEEDNRAQLIEHVKLNGVDDIVVIDGRAVSDRANRPVSMVGTGGGARITYAAGSTTTVTLGELIDEHGPISLLKMDIEGGEYDAFAWLSGEHLDRVERIALEWHGPSSPHLAHLGSVTDRWRHLIAFLADHGRVETIGRPEVGGLLYWQRY